MPPPNPRNGPLAHPVTTEVAYDDLETECIRLIEQYREERHLPFMQVRDYVRCLAAAGWLRPPARADVPPPPVSKELFTAGEAARIMRVSIQMVHRWIERGRLRAFRLGSGKGSHRRITRENLLDFMREHKMPIPGELAAA